MLVVLSPVFREVFRNLGMLMHVCDVVFVMSSYVQTSRPYTCLLLCIYADTVRAKPLTQSVDAASNTNQALPHGR